MDFGRVSWFMVWGGMWLLVFVFFVRTARGRSDFFFRQAKWVQRHRLGGWDDSREAEFKARIRHRAYWVLVFLSVVFLMMLFSLEK